MSQEFPMPDQPGSEFPPTPPEPPYVPPPPPPEIPSGAQTYPVPDQPRKDNRRVWTIVAIVLVVLCCCCLILGALGYYLYQNGDDIFGLGSVFSQLLM